MSRVSAVVGENLRRWRQTHELTQDEIAAAARAHGFNWVRSSVAELERGNRDLSLGEALALPFVLAHAGQRVGARAPELEDLLAIDSGSALEVGSLTLNATAVTDILRGRARRHLRRAPVVLNLLHNISERPGLDGALTSHWPDATPEQRARIANAHIGEAEYKAAQSLQCEPIEVAVLAHRLWGRPLAEQRDLELVQQHPEPLPARRVQALRGHITRELLDELREVVAMPTMDIGKPQKIVHIPDPST